MTPKLNWKPTTKDLREFGWVFGVGFGLIAALLAWRGHPEVARSMAAGALGIMLLALLAPPLAKPFYWLWMGVAWVMGSIMSRVILAVLFYAVFTPLALFFKLSGRDGLKRKPFKTTSYWTEHPEISKANYRRLF